VRLRNADFLPYGAPYIQFYRIFVGRRDGFSSGSFFVFGSAISFPVRPLRELARKTLVTLTIFGAEPGKSKKFPVTREFG
jgi:hypothetical protein